MAKKDDSYYMGGNVDIKEQIRKAKGNPNKNIHAKKKNSNYKQEIVQTKKEEQPLPKVPTGPKVLIIVVIVLLIADLFCNLVFFKDNQLVTYLSALYLGVACLILYGLRDYTYMRNPKTRDNTGNKILSWLLVIMGGLYIVTGASSLFTALR